mmetsp:Transcript_2466/g.5222  ORF Transcript_2466/g.5222 Transcript_2466/m.5222 type:complete len:419 (+) Transcript_2466:131-1387(+)
MSSANDIDDSSSSLDAIKSPLLLQSAPASLLENRSTTFEGERIRRTNDVRERLGPIIVRIKDSVTKIQSLENSMIQLPGGGGDEHENETNKNGGGGGNSYDCEMKQQEQNGKHPSTIDCTHQSRRRHVNKSMEIVKKKMLRLRNMEEELMALEGRRENLHRHCRQQIASKVAVDMVGTQSCLEQQPTGSLEHRNGIAEFEKEIHALKEKSLLVDDLRAQNARLVEKAEHWERSEMELANARKLCHKLETNLQKQKHKCKSLEYRVNSLKNTCDGLQKVLRARERRNLGLELELMDTRGLLSEYLSNDKNPPKTIEHPGSTSQSFALTDPLTLSWTESSITDETVAVDNDDSTTSEELSLVVPITNAERKGIACDSSLLKNLMAKIEALNRENAELRNINIHAIIDTNPMNEEMLAINS